MSGRRLRIAIQKAGKLSEGSIDLLNKCNFNIRVTKNHYLIQSQEMDVDILLVRDDDIPGFVDSDASDIGIVGENGYTEYTLLNPMHKLKIIHSLQFAACRLSIAVNSDLEIKTLLDLNNKTIATSYPAILRDFLNKHQINAKILVMHGSVELAPKIGIANAICDLVSTGTTLKENSLSELHVILPSQAVLIGHKTPSPAVAQFIRDLVFRFQSVISASQSKYIMLHIPKNKVSQLKNLLPGCEAPTVLPLHGIDNTVAVHVVSQESMLWDTITKLKLIGASTILVLPIEKMME